MTSILNVSHFSITENPSHVDLTFLILKLHTDDITRVTENGVTVACTRVSLVWTRSMRFRH